MNSVIVNSKIYSEEGIIENGYISIKDSIISEIGIGEYTVDSSDIKVIDACGKSIVPGFVDLQVNGAGGYLTTDGNNEHLQVISNTLAKCGTTSFLVATSPCNDEEHLNLINIVKNFMDTEYSGSRILGIHMEGPFLNPEKAGANDPSFISLPNIKKFKEFVNDSCVQMMTVSPEIGDFSEIQKVAKECGVVLSIGHSKATYLESKQFFEGGCNMCTHLFNTMSTPTAREPGIIPAMVENKNVYGSIIFDGHHVHPSNLKMLYNLCGSTRLILITDSAPTAGTAQKEWVFDGFNMHVDDYTCYLDDGTIMGSSLTMNKAAMIAKKNLCCSTMDIIQMAAVNPAKLLNMYNRIGSLAVGKDADILILEDEESFDPYMVIINGVVQFAL